MVLHSLCANLSLRYVQRESEVVYLRIVHSRWPRERWQVQWPSAQKNCSRNKRLHVTNDDSFEFSPLFSNISSPILDTNWSVLQIYVNLFNRSDFVLYLWSTGICAVYCEAWAELVPFPPSKDKSLPHHRSNSAFKEFYFLSFTLCLSWPICFQLINYRNKHFD